jgi:hypothetical protein
MCSIQFRVKIISNNQEVVIQDADLALDDICTTYFVGTYVSITFKEGNTEPCAQILEIGNSCGPLQNPCSNDPNDLLNDLGDAPPATVAITSPVYVLTDCQGIAPTTQSTVSQLELYDGKVIKFIPASEEGKPTCLQVEKQICDQGFPEFNFGAVIVTDYFSTCAECLTVKPTTIEEVKKRSVSPGYNTPGCLPDYYDKVSCKFSESLYQEVIKKRYGIDFCCENDTDKWDIKKELLDLAAITDPNICETICPTDVVECSIKCFNIDTCNIDLYTLGLLVSNGDINLQSLLDLYAEYETSNPEVYSQIEPFFGACAINGTFCINLCLYSIACYANFEESLAATLAEIRDCGQLTKATEAENQSLYNIQKSELESCINDLEVLLGSIEQFTQELEQCQIELQALIDAGAPQNEIEDKEEECYGAEKALAVATETYNDVVDFCGGTVSELQAQLATLVENRTLSNQFYDYFSSYLQNVEANLINSLDQIDQCKKCNEIVALSLIWSTFAEYTTCSGTVLSTPLAPFVKVYSQVTTDYKFVNEGTPLSSEELQTVMNSIITISDECDELPGCADITDPPNCDLA